VKVLRRSATRRSDSGFTLLETVVSVGVISIVMTATAAFLVASGKVARRQQGTQVSARIAADAISQSRSVKGSALITGRDRISSETQWASAGPSVAAYLADSVVAWDPAAGAGAGASAALPTVARTVTVDGLAYYQSWYVGQCWLPSTGSTCGTTKGVGDVSMNRVIVAVTWTDNECGGTCSYVTSTLVSAEPSEPVFNLN